LILLIISIISYVLDEYRKFSWIAMIIIDGIHVGIIIYFFVMATEALDKEVFFTNAKITLTLIKFNYLVCFFLLTTFFSSFRSFRVDGKVYADYAPLRNGATIELVSGYGPRIKVYFQEKR